MSTDPIEAAERIREQCAISKEQMRRLHRFLHVGKAQVAESVTLPSGGHGDDYPGEHRLTLRLSPKVPITVSLRDGESRMTAEAVTLSSNGVHLSCRYRSQRPGEPRWIKLADVTHIEQEI